MGQKAVYRLLKELGGTALPAQLKMLSKIRYPDSSQDSYIYYVLQRLKRGGYVRKNEDGSWSITDEFPDN